MRKILLFLLLLLGYISEIDAVPACPYPIKYKQPDGSEITVLLKGDEKISWGETADGYKLLSAGENGWEYAVTDEAGNLRASGVRANEIEKRTIKERLFLSKVSKDIHFSKAQVNAAKSSWETTSGSEQLVGTSGFLQPNVVKSIAPSANGPKKVFTPRGTKKLLMILVQFQDVKFTKAQSDFNGLMNTPGYSANGAHGSVKDYFLETSYGQFDLTTDVTPHIYTAANNMAYYGADVNGDHSPKAGELMREAVLAADADGVDFSQYDNDGDGAVDGVYVIYAGYSQASGGPADAIWAHAGTITPAVTCDGKTVSKYSCSNELAGGSGTNITTIGVICHEFGHVCGAPDYYDTDYASSGGEYPGTGKWDVMCVGVYNGSPGGSQPAHLNPFEKIRAGWVTPVTLSSASQLTMPDITTNPVVYKYNTATTDEYFLMENRQQTGFNADVPGHGLLIYHYSKAIWDLSRNKTAPQGFYPVCASANTSVTTFSDATGYGNINSTGCPFPGSLGRKAFYDAGTPSAKSWAGVNTDKPITNITENANGTVSFAVTPKVDCSSAPATQASALTVTPVTYNTMNLSWTRGSGDKAIVVAREGSAVDFDPMSGTTYAANANFKSGDEIGVGNFVVYNGTGTSVSLTGLSGGTTYYFSVYEYNNADVCYKIPALTGNGTTNCTVDPATFAEDFERSSFGCWTAVDNTGQGNWNIGTTSNGNFTPALSGTYAYFSSEYGVSHSYNADLISPTFDLSSYANVVLKYKHLFDGSSYYPSTGTVSYSIDNGATWVQLATYTSDSSNPDPIALLVNAAAGKSQVKFKWNYTCSPTGAYMWAVDDIQLIDNTNNWTGAVDTDWFNAGNWSTGAIPTSAVSVVIPSAPANKPQINATGAACMNLKIQSGASLTMNSTTAYTLSVSGDFLNNGTFTPGNGTVDFNGTNALQTIAGTTTTTFNILSVSKGAQARILEVTSVIALTGTSNPLVINSGTFKLSSASIITPFTTNPTIGSTAGLWNNGGTINATNISYLYTGGLIRNTSGTLNLNAIRYQSTTSQTIIEGGIVNISRYFGPNSGGSVTKYEQSGGAIIFAATSTDIPFDLTNTSNTFTMSNGTIVIQKSSSNSNYDFKNLSSSCVVTGGTLQIGNASTTGSPIIRINSTAPIWNLTVNATGTPTAQLVTNPLTVYGDVTIGTGATIDANNLNLSLAGNWTNGGAFTPGTGTVTCNGATNQTLISGGSGAGKAFYNLVVNNPAGVTLSSNNLSVSNLLTFTSGVVSTGSNKLIIPASGSVSRTSGHVNGNLQKNIAAGTNVIRSFEVGDAALANYTPVTLTFAYVSTAGNITAATSAGDHAAIGSSKINPDKSVNRYWTLANDGVIFDNYNGTFSYVAADLDANATVSNLMAGKYFNSGWSYPVVSPAASSVTVSELTSLGDFQFGENKGVATALSDKTIDTAINIYTNATNHIVVDCGINGDVLGQVKVYNALGGVILTQSISQSITEIDAQLSSGIYLVAVQTAQKSVVKKVIIR